MLEILRGGKNLRLDMHSKLLRDDRQPVTLLAILAAGFGFYLVGLVLGLAKPEDRLTRRASLTLFVFAAYQLYESISSMFLLFTFWECVVFALICVGFPFQFALAYRFYYRFPQSAPRGRVWTGIEYLLCLWGGLLAITHGWWYLSVFREGPASFGFKGGPLTASNPFILAAAVAMCAVIARNYQLVKEPDQRRRIQWVIYGSLVGIVPGLLHLPFELALPYNESTARPLLYSSAIVNFMTVAIPLSIGYAVLKHRAFDVNVVIRRGLQHLFAKQGLQVILALPVAGLLYTIIVNRNLPLMAILTGNPLLLVLIAAAGVSLKYRRQLIQWIDGRFFREAYSQEQILLNLIEKIKALDSMQELSRLVSQEVESALHHEHVYVFYRGDEKRDLTLGYSSGGKSEDLRIAEDSGLLQWMRRQRGAQEFPLGEDNSLPDEPRAWLGQLDVNLIVPMGGADGRLSGLLLLGEKKSEEPYSKNDCQLLEAIASQMAVGPQSGGRSAVDGQKGVFECTPDPRRAKRMSCIREKTYGMRKFTNEAGCHCSLRFRAV